MVKQCHPLLPVRPPTARPVFLKSVSCRSPTHCTIFKTSRGHFHAPPACAAGAASPSLGSPSPLSSLTHPPPRPQPDSRSGLLHPLVQPVSKTNSNRHCLSLPVPPSKTNTNASFSLPLTCVTTFFLREGVVAGVLLRVFPRPRIPVRRSGHCHGDTAPVPGSPSRRPCGWAV